MKSKEIYQLVSKELGFDIVKKTTKERKFVYARSIANTLAYKYSDESTAKIGNITGITHATVLNSLQKYDNEYKYQTTPFNVELIKTRVENKIIKIKEKLNLIDDLCDFELKTQLAIVLSELKKKDGELRYYKTNYNLFKRKLDFNKNSNPLLNKLLSIPSEHIKSVDMKLDAIIKCLPKKNLSQINNANN